MQYASPYQTTTIWRILISMKHRVIVFLIINTSIYLSIYSLLAYLYIYLSIYSLLTYLYICLPIPSTHPYLPLSPWGPHIMLRDVKSWKIVSDPNIEFWEYFWIVKNRLITMIGKIKRVCKIFLRVHLHISLVVL